MLPLRDVISLFSYPSNEFEAERNGASIDRLDRWDPRECAPSSRLVRSSRVVTSRHATSRAVTRLAISLHGFPSIERSLRLIFIHIAPRHFTTFSTIDHAVASGSPDLSASQRSHCRRLSRFICFTDHSKERLAASVSQRGFQIHPYGQRRFENGRKHRYRTSNRAFEKPRDEPIVRVLI